MKDLLYELRIEDDTDEVFAISLVENPAIESDFVYFDIEKGSFVIEDVKSPFTKKLPAYIIKRKLVKFTYPEYLFLEV